MIPLWAIRYVLPGLGAVLALWAAYSWAHGRGVMQERGKWQAVAAKQAAQAAALAQERQDAVNRANTADAARTTAQAALMAALQQKVTVYAQSNNGRACGLDADGGMLANEAIAAANATVAASASPRL